MLNAWLVGHKGPLARLQAEHLKPTDNPTIIGRWLTLLKSALLLRRALYFGAALH
ncbi:hypothetical protein ACT691_03040 [Vibrio metschnikovii]